MDGHHIVGPVPGADGMFVAAGCNVSGLSMSPAIGEQLAAWITNGRPTEDPRAILASGRVLPMGEHKGSGLAFMIDLLTAGLAGGLLCYEQGTEGRPSDSEGGSTKLFMALRPFGDWLGERVTSLKAHLKAAPPAPEQGEAQWPGEGSFRRRAEYLQHGIALPPQLAAELEALAREMSLTIAFAG